MSQLGQKRSHTPHKAGINSHQSDLVPTGRTLAPMTSASPITHLWIAARTLFERMRGAVGEAADLAKQVWLPEQSIAEARRWLRTMETMVRWLVLIEAAARRVATRGPKLRDVVHLTNPVASKPARPPRPAARGYSFKLWSRPPAHPARIRMLGAPVLVREIWRGNLRSAQARQLNMVRFMRTPEPLRIARRIEALERVLAKPERAIRRLARRLRVSPSTAQRIALQRPPRQSCADPRDEAEAGRRAFQSAKPDTS